VLRFACRGAIKDGSFVPQLEVQSPLREKVEWKRGFDDGDENFRKAQMWKELVNEQLIHEGIELNADN